MQVRLRRLPILFTVILLLIHLFLVPLSIVYAQTENEIIEQSSTEEDSAGKQDLENSKIIESKESDHLESQENDELFHQKATEPIESPDSQVEVEDQLTEETNNNHQELSDQDIPTSEEIRFSIDVGDYLEVQKNEKFSIEVNTNQAIDSLRIVVPKGTNFSFTDEKTRTYLQNYDDESSLWLIKFNQKTDLFPATISVVETGQISVEDADGDINSAFLFVKVPTGNRTEISEHTMRSSVNATSVATFRNAWNNSSTTQININSSISLTAAQVNNLDTRVANITLVAQQNANVVEARVPGSVLPISSSATLTLSAGQSNSSMAWGGGGIRGEPIRNFSILTGNIVVRQGAFLRYYAGSRALSLTLQDGAWVSTDFGSTSIGTLNLISGQYVSGDLNGSFMMDIQGQNNLTIGTLNINSKNLYNVSRGVNKVNLWRGLVATISGNTIVSSNHGGLTIERFGNLNAQIYLTDIPGIANEFPVDEIPINQEYSLSLQASPSEGGRPTASTTTLAQGGTTTITANPNSDYRFVRWEIISGTGASITNTTSASTTFTMGSSNASIRAVYEGIGTNPVDPPEPEINPEGFNLIASPSHGGSPAYVKSTNTGWDIYNLTANPNTGFRFVRWEIVIGTGDLYFEDSPHSGQYVTTPGSSATIRAVYERISYDLKLEASPSTGGTPEAESYSIGQGESTTITANPSEGYDFIRWEITSGSGSSIEEPTDESTVFTMGNSNVTVQAIYEESQSNGPVTPVDPLDPEVEVNPENKPELPENQELLSIDFVSSFNFGSQSISVHDQTYYAQPQRLLNEDGTVNESEERPNYVQISDRRSESERNGWQLAVTQKEQFKNQTNKELIGARLNLLNQQLLTAQGGEEPSLQATDPLALVPGNKRTLIRAEGTEGTGTWVYRFGDGETAEESVSLDVPKSANPEATNYSTTLTWELSAVPDN
ncbi:WxL domain-containing protein [Enterococcus casseliflavus]|nr:WxL domain-containing protein [Enterococcus casseliflavus]